ncbi:hypothetical protein [Salinibaculum rarum]|uniref:hypothetical protein n=1 Tax=Salinibaculum rarum TaxID=3058903 RepID=UPI00265E4258|nr:hypothetical protein [Salinibaculum sp. KK48]
MPTTHDLNLPARAHHPDTEAFPKPHLNDNTPVVGRVEQYLRVDFAQGGIEHGLEFARQTINKRQTTEKETVLDMESFRDRITHDEADPFVEAKLREIYEQMQTMRGNRDEWYGKMHSELENRFQRAIGMLNSHPQFNPSTPTHVPHDKKTTGHIDFTVYHVVQNRDNEHAELPTIHRSELDGVTRITEFGYDLPQAFIVAESPSGSLYPFVPWYGVTVCTCGDKIENFWNSPFCKHEIAALLMASEDSFTTLVSDIHARFRRLMNYDVYAEHDPAQYLSAMP